jgi:hypothetical protein
MNARRRWLCTLPIALAFAGCATQYAPETFADPYGFFSGLLHGFLFPFALIGNILSWVLSLVGISFLDSVTLIGRPNTGLWYYVGFGFSLFVDFGGAQAGG